MFRDRKGSQRGREQLRRAGRRKETRQKEDRLVTNSGGYDALKWNQDRPPPKPRCGKDLVEPLLCERVDET